MEPASFATAVANSVMLLFGFISKERQQAMDKEKFAVLQVLEELKGRRFPMWSTVLLIKHRKKLQNFSLVFMKHLYEELKEKQAK